MYCGTQFAYHSSQAIIPSETGLFDDVYNCAFPSGEYDSTAPFNYILKCSLIDEFRTSNLEHLADGLLLENAH